MENVPGGSPFFHSSVSSLALIPHPLLSSSRPSCDELEVAIPRNADGAFRRLFTESASLSRRQNRHFHPFGRYTKTGGAAKSLSRLKREGLLWA